MDHFRLQSTLEPAPLTAPARSGSGTAPRSPSIAAWPGAALAWLEQRLALPTDSEQRRLQKVVAVIVGLGGGGMALVLGALYAIYGATPVATLYFVTTLWIIVSVGVLLIRPGAYYGIVMATSVHVTLHPWVVTVATGGYSSGLLPMMWALVGPVIALLLLDKRPALLNAGLFVMAALAAAVVDPIATANPLLLTDRARLALGLLSATVPSMMLIFSSVFLVDRLEAAFGLADALLHNMLPASIAQRLKASPALIAEGYEDVTVLFADIVDFTRLSDGVDPCQIVTLLNSLFAKFDVLCGKHGLEKIKTIGDAYMVVGGLDAGDDHCRRVIEFAIDMLEISRRHTAWDGRPIALRIGVHRGPVVAGVIGQRKFSFDVWGDTVNVASRMEYLSLPDVIQITAAVRAGLGGRYPLEPRDPFYVKGKGLMTTYLLRPPTADAA